MKKNMNASFTAITVIIGFMLAIQFQSVNEPKVRDTRDIWQLRQALAKEMKTQSHLLEQISDQETKLEKYQTEMKGSKEEALKQTLHELKKEAGLTNIDGPGIILTIVPIEEELRMGTPAGYVSPDSLKRLVNELNRYGARHIAIDGQRVINTTVIRDINGATKVGGYTLNTLPFDIRVIADTKEAAANMHSRMQISSIADDFFIDNLKVEVSKPKGDVVLPAYEEPLRIRNVEPVEEKGEN